MNSPLYFKSHSSISKLIKERKNEDGCDAWKTNMGFFFPADMQNTGYTCTYACYKSHKSNNNRAFIPKFWSWLHESFACHLLEPLTVLTRNCKLTFLLELKNIKVNLRDELWQDPLIESIGWWLECVLLPFVMNVVYSHVQFRLRMNEIFKSKDCLIQSQKGLKLTTCI